MRVVWSPLAIDRVDEIARRIAGDRPRAAREWVNQLFASVRRLEAFPRSGRTAPEVEHRANVRELIDGDYRVIYRVDRDQIVVLTVRHSRQVTTADDLDY